MVCWWQEFQRKRKTNNETEPKASKDKKDNWQTKFCSTLKKHLHSVQTKCSNIWFSKALSGKGNVISHLTFHKAAVTTDRASASFHRPCPFTSSLSCSIHQLQPLYENGNNSSTPLRSQNFPRNMGKDVGKIPAAPPPKGQLCHVQVLVASRGPWSR